MSDISINLLSLLAKDPLIFIQQPDLFRVSFTTTDEPFRLKRVHKLAQISAKILLTVRGSDEYAPTIGTGIRSLLNRLVSKSNIGTIKRDIALWIRDAEKQMKDEQERQAFPLDERVSKLVLRTAEFSFATLTWTIRVNIVTEAGTEAILNLEPQITMNEFPSDATIGLRDVLSINTDPIL